MRKTLVALFVTLAAAVPAAAGNSSVTIGFDVPAYPVLQRIPDFPVYYAPRLRTNYFFYDGLYWVFDGGDWYSSAWYNGPWDDVDRYEVPAALLHVPLRYYRSRPVSFRTYRVDAAPHWHRHWGHRWAERRADWERRDARRAPAATPLPVYQRRYTHERYPAIEQQYAIRSRNYRHEPRDLAVRETHREHRAHVHAAPAARQREGWGPPAHAPAHGYRDKEQRERAKEAWQRVKGQRKWARERAREEREWRHERRQERLERVAGLRYKDED